MADTIRTNNISTEVIRRMALAPTQGQNTGGHVKALEEIASVASLPLFAEREGEVRDAHR